MSSASANCEVGRRGVDRVAAEDDEDVDPAGVHVGDELAQRLQLIDRRGLDRLGVDDRRAGVAERLVHRVRERVDGRRLAVAGDHEARAAMRLQILGDRGDPLSCRSPGGSGGRAGGRAPATPTAAASARASASMSLGRSGRR